MGQIVIKHHSMHLLFISVCVCVCVCVVCVCVRVRVLCVRSGKDMHTSCGYAYWSLGKSLSKISEKTLPDSLFVFLVHALY